MRNTICGIRNLGLYLLPVSLLATAGVLLTALLYYPGPATIPDAEPRVAAVVDEEYWRAHAESLFAALLADALSQIQAERETRARTLIYHYERDASSAESPAMLRLAPPSIKNGGGSNHAVLIRL